MPSPGDGPRIRVLGSSGSGKTTAGRAIAASLSVPFLELDNVFWYASDPMYQRSRPEEECRQALSGFLRANTAWVIDGSYGAWSGEALEQATELALLEAPLPRRVLRLFRRWWVGRRGLKGGDDATLLSFLQLVRWTAWTARKRPRERLETVRASGLPWTYCRSDEGADTYLARFPGALEHFRDDVRHGHREPEAVISGRRAR